MKTRLVLGHQSEASACKIRQLNGVEAVIAVLMFSLQFAEPSDIIAFRSRNECEIVSPFIYWTVGSLQSRPRLHPKMLTVCSITGLDFSFSVCIMA